MAAGRRPIPPSKKPRAVERAPPPQLPALRRAVPLAVRLPAAPTVDRARKMRRTATGLLVLMAGIFIAAYQFGNGHPAWGYVIAFSEAAMVGGLADWFAVTALFRHPMGIPIPHTAIIPNKKDRIADTMAGFLRDNFLTPGVVARRMHHMNLAQAIGDWLAEPRPPGKGRLSEGATGLFADILESLDPERLGSQVQAGLARQIEKIEVSPLLGSALGAAIAEGRHRPLLEALVRWTGLDERLANSVLDGLYRLLAEVLIDPEHPLRKTVEEGLEKLAKDLATDPETRARVEAAKAEILSNPVVADWWTGIWEQLRTSLIEAARNPDKVLSGQLSGAMAELGRALREDPALQWQVNRFARRTAVGVASRYGAQIVQLVSETVRRWDAQVLTTRIEGAVGRDLQFIRINGTLVGGLVGVIIHTVAQWL